MTANIEVLGEKKPHVLTVPVESVFSRDSQDVVYVKKNVDAKTAALAAKGKKDDKDNKEAWKTWFERRVVTTGLSDNAHVEIISGIKPGEEVALEDPTLPNDKKKDENDD